MKTSLREYLLEYSTPDTEIVYALYADLVCNSPGGGENEDVGYEEW